MDKLTQAIDAYNTHMQDCRHAGRDHAVTCWTGSDMMRRIEREAKALESAR